METQIIKTENVGAIVDATTINVTDFAEAIERSASVDKLKPLMTLTADYIELEKPSESFRGIYVGLQEMNITDKATGELKALKAARFIINKKIYINAGAVLVGELQRGNIPVGTPLQVTYERKEGNTKIYSITLLG
jgi:hypothetical protein